MNRIPGQVHYGATVGWQQKNRTEFSSTANIELDLTGNNQHLIIFSSVKPTGDSAEMTAEVSLDNGSTWKSGASDYEYLRTEVNDTTETHAGAAAANIPITAANVMGVTGSPAGWSGEVRVFQHSNGRCQIQWHLSGQETDNSVTRYEGSAFYDLSANPVTNIRFDIGTFASGNCIHMIMD